MKSVQPIFFLNSTYSRTGNIITIDTLTPNPFTIGYPITTINSPLGLENRTYLIDTIINNTTFTIIDNVSGDISGTTTIIDTLENNVRKIISNDENGFVRGESSIIKTYLQKYRMSF
jgi:hypothetical protein